MLNKNCKMTRIRRNFLLLVLTLLLLSVGCQPAINSSVIESTKINSNDSTTVPIIQTRIPPTEIQETVTNVSVTNSPPRTPVLDSLTSQPVEKETPTSPAPTAVSTYPVDILKLNTQIAFLGQSQETGDYLIGVIDTTSNNLNMIADNENVEFGTPLWGPNKDRLAFTVSDNMTVSLQISDIKNSTQTFLDMGESFEQKNNDGVPFLFGWSGNAEWLAYAFIYPTTKQDLYLVNVQTGENILIDNPDSLWFSWSPRDETFVFTDSSALYIGDVESSNDLEIYQGRGYIGLMSWHPSENVLLVGISTNIAGDLNQLWELNIDSGEWFRIGEYPELTHFKYAPNGKSIAVHLQDRLQELNRLLIVDPETGSVVYETELPANSFFDLKWIDNVTIGLTAQDNIYVVPIKAPSLSYWVLDNEIFVNDQTFLIHSIDW